MQRSPVKVCLIRPIKTVRKEEIDEEREKGRRSLNFIIHGVLEESSSNISDQKWVENLIKDLKVYINIKQISRIGEVAFAKKRPILVVLNNEEEKKKLFGNLSTLKGIRKYINMSVTEDFTPKERKIIRRLSKEAEERNDILNSDDFTWRVRGSSKTGFFLKKIKTKNAYVSMTDS